METVAAVASIAGIVELTRHGIQLIRLLKKYAKACEMELAEDFVHGLVSAAQLLEEAHILCIRIQKHANANISRIRTATLCLQVEDCISDLETWHRIVKRLESTAEKRITRVGKWARTETTIRRFQHFCKIAFKSTANGTSADQRQAIQERFEQHKHNIGIALSMLGA